MIARTPLFYITIDRRLAPLQKSYAIGSLFTQLMTQQLDLGKMGNLVGGEIAHLLA